nr:unnamed protein product [Spirometra erinaceieuropaei]
MLAPTFTNATLDRSVALPSTAITSITPATITAATTNTTISISGQKAPDAPSITSATATTSDVDSVPTCPHCGRAYTSHIGLVGHMRVHHTEAAEPVLERQHTPDALALTARIARVYSVTAWAY